MTLTIYILIILSLLLLAYIMDQPCSLHHILFGGIVYGSAMTYQAITQNEIPAR